MEFVTKLFQSIWNFFKTHLLVVFILLGIGLILLSYLFIKSDYPDLHTTLIGIGYSILSGGCLGAIVRSQQFTGIFSENLRNIVYCEEALEKRNDLHQIWKNVSKALYDSKFPDISDEIQQRIINVYFPTNHQYYQEKFHYEISVKDFNDNYIQLSEIDTTVLIPVSKETEITYNFSSKIPIPLDENGVNDITKYELKEIYVNGRKIDFSKYLTIEKTDKLLEVKFELKVQGEKRYEIKKKEEKIYNLNVNPYKKHTLQYFTKNFELDIEIDSENLDIIFSELGTSKVFKDVDSVGKSKRIRKKNSEILFPKQGFILFYKKNP